MPKVSGKSRTKPAKSKKPAARSRGGRAAGRGRAKAPEPGILEKIAEGFRLLMDRVVSTVITYTVVVAVLAVAAVAIALVTGGYGAKFGEHFSNFTHDLARGAGFEVTQVTWRGAVQTRAFEMENALAEASPRDIIGHSLLHFPTREARRRVEELGWVHHAVVSRLWPGTIHITVTERIPAALWQRDGSGRLFLIDREGVEIDKVGAHQYTGLPLIIGTDNPAEAGDLLRALGAYPKLSARVANLTRHTGGRWDVGLRGGLTILLPEENYGAALDKLAVLDRDGGLSNSSEVFDMRNPDADYSIRRKGE